MAVRFTAYGGAGEIGGNKLLLEDGDWQVMLDFGLSFGALERYFEEFLTPRAAHGLSDYLQTGLLPPLEGLYRADLTQLPEHAHVWERLRGRPGYRNDVCPRAVLLSHAHADHVSYVSMLRPSVPVVASATTALIAKAMQDSGLGGVSAQTVFWKGSVTQGHVLRQPTRKGFVFQQRPWTIVDGAAWQPGAADYWARRYTKGEAPETRAAVLGAGDIDGRAVRAFPVDHSIPGACGFAVETSAGWIGYSGDIRMHGRRGRQTLRFAEELAKLDLAALICEGTQAGKPPGASEDDVRARAIERVRAERGLVVADFGPRNIERLEGFLAAARAAGRRLVILDKDALILKAMRTVDPAVPTPAASEGLLIYADYRTGARGWRAAVLAEFADALVGPSAIRAAPGEYVLCLSFYDAPRLLDVGPTPGVWIYSSSEPYNEEQLLDRRRLHNWTRLLGLDFAGAMGDDEAEQAGFHASGHASGPDLEQFVTIANPRVLIPVHLQDDGLAFYLRTFGGSSIDVREPRWGEPIDIG